LDFHENQHFSNATEEQSQSHIGNDEVPDTKAKTSKYIKARELCEREGIQSAHLN